MIPNGTRDLFGGFNMSQQYTSVHWAANLQFPGFAYIVGMYYNNTNFTYNNADVKGGFAVRLVKGPEITTTTTTTAPPTTTTTTTVSVIQGLEGLKIETLYINQQSDMALLPNGYVHPCPSQISAHDCARGFFEVTGNDVYIGDSLMNNSQTSPQPGAVTQSGKLACHDDLNTPAPLTHGTWLGNPFSRYSEMTITAQQAIDIANANPGNCIVEFKLVPTMVTYNCICDNDTVPHDNVTWTRISKPDGTVIYNDCPINNITTINICV
jgi:hypothetical protein